LPWAVTTGKDRTMAGGVGEGDDSSGTDRIRVLTLNLLSPQHVNWERRRPVLIDGLRKLRPDLVAFQETVWGNGCDQLADLLRPDFRVARHSGRSTDRVGAALASRWPLGATGEVDLHLTARTADFPWCAVPADLDPERLGALLFGLAPGYVLQRLLLDDVDPEPTAPAARPARLRSGGRRLNQPDLRDRRGSDLSERRGGRGGPAGCGPAGCCASRRRADPAASDCRR